MNKLWHGLIGRYGLGSDADEISKKIAALSRVYPDGESENMLFFVYMKNRFGAYLSEISEDHTDLLSWVSIVRRNDIDLYMYVFEEHDDFVLYCEFIGRLSDKIDKNILDFFNSNCPEWVVKNSN